MVTTSETCVAEPKYYETQLLKWLEEMSFDKLLGKVEIYHESHGFRVYLYSRTYKYSIFACDGYLGSHYTCREQRPGEDWFRGGDLLDGRFSEATFNGIIKDIVRNELIAIPK